MRKNAAVLGAIVLAALALALQLRLGPRWQEALVQALIAGLILTTLLAFVRLRAWTAFASLIVTVGFYDVFLMVSPPLPKSIVLLYLAMTVLGVIVYISVSEVQLRDMVGGFRDLFANPEAARYRTALLVLAPLWFSSVVLAKSFPELTPPLAARTVHPEPPSKITAYGKPFDMIKGVNPYRALKSENPERFARLVAEGKDLYYRNCFFCHGDNLEGKGQFAEGFNPRPANFQDVGTIAMLQESYVYWRVLKGGPGMPAAGQPWSSAMPVWE
ncbi:MAG: cytochrome c, partial [Elusimicrobiota bacterium]